MGSGRTLALLAGAVLLLGIADSMSAPYLVLFAVDQAHLSPLQVGLFASASGVGGIVVSSVLGRRFDRRPTRVHIVTVALAGAIGYALLVAGSLALPLFVTRELHQPATALGWLFSACAFVEVLGTLALAGLPARISQRWLIVAAMGLFVVYFVVTLLASGMGVLLAAQIARGGAIAIVGAAGIRYFQDVMAPATGRATTLFANAATAGQLVAGVLAGSSLQVLGYRPTLLLCAVIALLGTLIFALTTRPQWVPAAG
jgi:predicted MFS family arabinose efflux permease